MKIVLLVLLATPSFAAASAASPRLTIDTVVTDSDASVEASVLGRAHLVTEDGVRTRARVGAFEYLVTPTLRPDGTVHLSEVVIHHYDNGKEHAFGPYERNLARGDSAELALGGIFFSTTASTAK